MAQHTDIDVPECRRPCCWTRTFAAATTPARSRSAVSLLLPLLLLLLLLLGMLPVRSPRQQQKLNDRPEARAEEVVVGGAPDLRSCPPLPRQAMAQHPEARFGLLRIDAAEHVAQPVAALLGAGRPPALPWAAELEHRAIHRRDDGREARAVLLQEGRHAAVSPSRPVHGVASWERLRGPLDLVAVHGWIPASIGLLVIRDERGNDVSERHCHPAASCMGSVHIGRVMQQDSVV